jgi:hypothetical protein
MNEYQTSVIKFDTRVSYIKFLKQFHRYSFTKDKLKIQYESAFGTAIFFFFFFFKIWESQFTYN